MRPKVIEKDRLRVQDESDKSARLSYEMVFVDTNDVDEDVSIAIEKVNTQWEHRLVTERKKAVDQGYSTGFQDGRQKAKEEIDTHLANFQLALNDFDTHLQETIESLKPAINALVFDLSDKVIGVPVQSEELQQKVSATINAYLKELSDDSKAVITVSEHDYESVQHLKNTTTHLKHINIEMDGSLNPGEYRVDANHGVLLNNFRKILADFRNTSKLDDWGKK